MMTRTADDVKKGLEHCSSKKPCLYCPMWDECKEALGLKPLFDNTLAYIRQLEAENKQYHQENTEMYSEMCMLREKVHRLEAERDAAVGCIGKLTVILKTYPYAATNGCAYEAYMEIKKYIEAVRGVQKEE